MAQQIKGVAGPSIQQETGPMRVVAGKARIVILAGDQVGRVYPIDHSCIVGRSDEVDISLPQPEISRHHARISYRDDEGWTIEDLGSANGTCVDSFPVQGRALLKFGARIMLGGSVLFIFTHHDVLEDQILQMQKLESLGRLAGEVAHDLRNMLTVFQYNVGLLEEALDKGQLLPIGGFSPLDLQESISSLTEATNQASGLTGRLLGFARVGPGGREPVDMADLVEKVVAMVQRTFPANIQVDSRCSGADLVVSGGFDRLNQALMNLCINARDAMPHGGKLFLSVTRLQAASAALVDLPISGNIDHIVLSVRDNGDGMDEATRGQIFEPFFTTKGEGRGTGLGLATVYAVIRDHGGDIQVNSTPGHGSEFTVILPQASISAASWNTARNMGDVHGQNPTGDRLTVGAARRLAQVIGGAGPARDLEGDR